MELGKLAIDYSDGVVQVDDQVNAELVRYAQSENKPLIVHPQAEAEVKGLYADFYGKLLGGIGGDNVSDVPSGRGTVRLVDKQWAWLPVVIDFMTITSK